jgi:hypothetical protein
MPTLADIYSGIDTAKRKAGNFIRQPLSTLQEVIALANDQARLDNRLTSLSAQGARREMRGQPMTQEQALADQELQQRLIDQMNVAGTTSYKGSHTAPNAKTYGATLDDLTKIMPSDVYSHMGKQLYGIGDRLIDSEWRIAALKSRNKPDAVIDVFRAVPKGVKEINSGDWVTTSPAYAKWHGENVLNGDYEIVKKQVPAKKLSTEGYPYEFGYHE